MAGALHHDPGDTVRLEPLGHELADRDGFLHVVAITLALLGGVGEPPAAVLRGDPESEPGGVDLLTHTYGSLLLHGSDNHGHVAGARAGLEGTTLWSRAEPLHGRPLIDDGGWDGGVTL